MTVVDRLDELQASSVGRRECPCPYPYIRIKRVDKLQLNRDITHVNSNVQLAVSGNKSKKVNMSLCTTFSQRIKRR